MTATDVRPVPAAESAQSQNAPNPSRRATQERRRARTGLRVPPRGREALRALELLAEGGE